MSDRNYKLKYNGSIGWLIFWIIIFFPIALVLLLIDSTFQMNQNTYRVHYSGSKFWLCFWVLVFFPIAFVLLFINGLAINIDHSRPPNDSTNQSSTEI